MAYRRRTLSVAGAAEYDTLHDEARAYADRLKSSGVETKYTCYDGMIHGFLQMAGLVDEAQAAIDEISRTVGVGGNQGPRTCGDGT